MDKCPFCRSGVEDNRPYKTSTALGRRIDFECQSQLLFSNKGDIQKIKWRGPYCYETELTAFKERISILESICGEAYQMAGQVGAAERILDNLSDAANGRPLRHKTFLPVTDDDFSELTALKELLRRAVGINKESLICIQFLCLNIAPQNYMQWSDDQRQDISNIQTLLQTFLTDPRVAKVMEEK